MAGKALDKIRFLINIATEDRETGKKQTLVTVDTLEEIAKEVEDLEERIAIMEEGLPEILTLPGFTWEE